MAFAVGAAAIDIGLAPAKFVTWRQCGSLPGLTSFSHAMSATFWQVCTSSHQLGTKLNCRFGSITALAAYITAFTHHSEVVSSLYIICPLQTFCLIQSELAKSIASELANCFLRKIASVLILYVHPRDIIYLPVACTD